MFQKMEKKNRSIFNFSLSKVELSCRIIDGDKTNLGLLHRRWILYRLSHQGSPMILWQGIIKIRYNYDKMKFSKPLYLLFIAYLILRIDFHQAFKEELIWIFFKLFQKVEAKRILPNTFYEACLIQTTKLDK